MPNSQRPTENTNNMRWYNAGTHEPTVLNSDQIMPSYVKALWVSKHNSLSLHRHSQQLWYQTFWHRDKYGHECRNINIICRQSCQTTTVPTYQQRIITQWPISTHEHTTPWHGNTITAHTHIHCYLSCDRSWDQIKTTKLWADTNSKAKFCNENFKNKNKAHNYVRDWESDGRGSPTSYLCFIVTTALSCLAAETNVWHTTTNVCMDKAHCYNSCPPHSTGQLMQQRWS